MSYPKGKWITITRTSRLRFWQTDGIELKTSDLHSILNDQRNNPKHTIDVMEGISEKPNDLELAILNEDTRAALSVLVQSHGMEWVKEQLNNIRH